jgi:hypothetical protein
MEKPGMGGRRKPPGAGLLIRPPVLAAALLAGAWTLGAQTPAGELRVLAETAPAEPLTGGLWTITFLVDHPRPGEVEVLPPPWPAALAFDSMRREARFVEQEPWTLVEYRFVIRGSGGIRLGPFEIASPRGRARIGPLSLEVRAAPRLVWENIPPRLAVGEALEFSLRLVDRGSGPPPAAAPLPPAPRDCILEALELRPGDREAGRVLRLRLIPLAAGEFVLPAAAASFGNPPLEIPPLRIRVFSSAPREGRP